MPIDVRGLVHPGGFLEAWLKYAEPYESPDSYFLFSLLTIASSAINDRIRVNPGGEPTVSTNIYTVLYGPSGARKSTAIRHAVWLLNAAMPEAPMLPRGFTMEALQHLLATKSKESGKADGTIITDEISDLIGVEYRLSNTRFLSDVWDCPPVVPLLTIARGYKEIHSPYIVLLAASAPGWLEGVDSKTLAGGFLRRIFIINEYGAKRDNSDPVRDMAIFNALVRMFRDRLGPDVFARVRMPLSPAAQQSNAGWYQNIVKPFHRASDERAGHFASCMQAHSFKLAAIIQLLEGGGYGALDVAPLTMAQRLVEVIIPPMFQAYASLVPTPFARLQAGIIRTVQACGGVIQEPALDRMVKASTGQKPREVWLAKESLIRDGVLRRDGSKIVIG